MPVLNGIEATRLLAGVGVPEPVKVLVVTTFNLDEYVYEALRAGASGFLLKDAPPFQLLQGIRTVAAGAALLAPEVTRQLLGRYATRIRPPDGAVDDVPLARRELEVLRLIANGLSNSEIAGNPRDQPRDRQDLRFTHPDEAGPSGPGTGGRLRLPSRPHLTTRPSCHTRAMDRPGRADVATLSGPKPHPGVADHPFRLPNPRDITVVTDEYDHRSHDETARHNAASRSAGAS